MGLWGGGAEIVEPRSLKLREKSKKQQFLFSELAQQHQGPGSYLRFLHPMIQANNSSVSSPGSRVPQSGAT